MYVKDGKADHLVSVCLYARLEQGMSVSFTAYPVQEEAEFCVTLVY